MVGRTQVLINMAWHKYNFTGPSIIDFILLGMKRKINTSDWWALIGLNTVSIDISDIMYT